ncbi:sulfite exporter TauE/SafE family protein [uncultured Tateyamaria sp.]|uniref:sulfite exporter TauE/SafE family protein n=1 Tax=uncultured Tateyamaria sp. TaxID=455651 RepID=UPI0026397062|nr:sulfite exporter TauE/SafE family protein [uncultured Tateyamaria sp.]
MLELDFWFFAIAAPAVVFAGISKAGFGSGASFASASILALVLDPGLALGVILPLLMLMDVSALKPYWGKWDWVVSGRMILGALPGVALGALLFVRTDADVFRVLIGAISIGFVIWQVGRARGWIRLAQAALPAWVGVLTGAVAGFTSFVSHAGGPPAAVYLLSLNPTKTGYQANTVLIFTAINVFKFVPYAFLGMFTLQTFTANLALAPFALLGAWMGVRAHHLVPERAFFALTYVLLLLTGTKLIWDGLT